MIQASILDVKQHHAIKTSPRDERDKYVCINHPPITTFISSRTFQLVKKTFILSSLKPDNKIQPGVRKNHVQNKHLQPLSRLELS